MAIIVRDGGARAVVVVRSNTIHAPVRVARAVVVTDKGASLGTVERKTATVKASSTGVQGIPGDAADLPGTTDQLAEGTVNKYAKTFEFTQPTPDTVWTINHNLGFMPAVELRTIGGVEFDADVQHPNTNQTIVYLLTALAGTARLN